ncbi:MAG: peptidase M61 [Bacteroidia bacterium]
MITPAFDADTAVYRMPAMVPGTYKVYDFGRFTDGFRALTKDGKELPVQQTDENTWKIAQAKSLYKITYKVEDTWDTKKKSDFVFEPAGTNFQKDTNFVLNNHGLFGYFEGKKKNEYQVSVTHPEGFFGATGLNNVRRKDNTDTYIVPNYMDLVDGPIMYCLPDTTHLNVGGTDILISVYSPKKLVSSKFVADSLRLILEQQRQYLGGKLPVNNYAFIIYLTSNPAGFQSGSLGALEHSYSSMYTLLEMEPKFIAQTVKDVAAHEFFHIVTPLNIHSYEIGDFDYNNPKMSRHLWMYEGLTEYAAHHVQIKYGTLSLEDYLIDISDKMLTADKYNQQLSFTEMSLGCLGKYEDQYGNVYQKGALIGMCLDIKLRQLSDGKYGTQELMRDLSLKYGKNVSFTDTLLFDEIVKLTYPEIGDFLRKYVGGSEPLPFRELLGACGIEYIETRDRQILDPLGGYVLIMDTKNQIRLWPEEPNDFGKEMGYQKLDILQKINGKKIKPSNAQKRITKFMSKAQEGDKITMTVKRKTETGEWKTIELKGTLHKVSVPEKHVLVPFENPSPEQLKLRKAWINR